MSSVSMDDGFAHPVDREHKYTRLPLMSCARPHMMAFHISVLCFFTTFFSTFAVSPLEPIIRDDIDMTIVDIGNGGIAAVTGNIICRLVMGAFCDSFGPRLGFCIAMLGVAPAVLSMALQTTPIGFIMCRFFVGFGLATFVSCQFWVSVMFNPRIVGLANATAAGWGNMGGGVTQFTIPAVFLLASIANPPYTAWRITFFLPGCMHIITGLMCMFLTQDLPDGQYTALRKKGAIEQPSTWMNIKCGVTNYRSWCLVLLYGFSFGVELTMNNIAASYFYDHFQLDLSIAGILASLFGMMNIFARSVGGWCSDYAAQHYGMRGRLWALWSMMTIEGVLCVIMGLTNRSLALTLVAMLLFSIMVQASEGGTYGIVPFVSKRALGVVVGMVGAGGNAGSAIIQSIYFNTAEYETYEGIFYMGVMIITVSLVVSLIHFPMWGSMFSPGDHYTREEDYYTSAYTEEEKEKGVADVAYKFAAAARDSEAPKSSSAFPNRA